MTTPHDFALLGRLQGPLIDVAPAVLAAHGDYRACVRALVKLRGLLAVKGLNECPHDDKRECPWSETHEAIDIIDAALSAFTNIEGE